MSFLTNFEGDTFTAKEVHDLLNRPVTAKRGGYLKAGSTGTISEYRRTPCGWLIVVTWSDNTSDVFSKKDARKSLSLGSRQ